mmetsp:Transcript_9962/g.19218  ORF Transcript_9962/g.19218 Transcript_9962/m.19218 type:complete len:128 (-) Transcript_9962:368-751(-)
MLWVDPSESTHYSVFQNFSFYLYFLWYIDMQNHMQSSGGTKNECNHYYWQSQIGLPVVIIVFLTLTGELSNHGDTSRAIQTQAVCSSINRTCILVCISRDVYPRMPAWGLQTTPSWMLLDPLVVHSY